MNQSKKSSTVKSPVYSSVSCAASATIAAGINLDAECDGNLELSVETENGRPGGHRLVTIAYKANKESALEKIVLTAEHAALLPRLFRTLEAKSRALEPIEAIEAIA